MAVYYSTIEYNANGGSGAPAATRRVDTVYQSTGAMAYEYVRVDYGVPTRTGYNFINWKYTQYDADRYAVGGDQIQFQYSFNGYDQYKTVTCYAQWQLQTYTISYNANGGTGAPSAQTKTYGTNLTLSSTVPTRTNYIFQGWATSSTGAVQYQPGATFTTNTNTTLYAIWAVAAATLNSVSNTTIGSSGTASWTKVNNSHTYKLTLSMSGASSVNVNVSAGSSSTNFTIPNSWLSALHNSTSATATAVLYTYNGSTLVGSTQKTFTVSVASSVKPSISSFTSAPHSNNATVEGWGVVVQGYSYLALSVSATAGTGASISNISFSGHGISQSSTSTSGNTAVVTSTGSLTYTVTVKDSRGRTASTTLTVTSYAYSNPEVSSLTAVRCLSDGTQSDTEGEYIKAYPVFVFSSVNNNNSLTVKKIEYKQHDSSTWTEVTAAAVSGSWTSVFGPADITKTFDVRCTVTDAVGNTYVLSVSVPPVVGFALGLKNDRARFGGPVEKAGLQVDWPTEFNDAVDITNRRCSATLSSAGWYRVLHVTNPTGSISRVIDLTITRNYANANNESHCIKYIGNYNSHSFNDEVSKSNTILVDKVRYTTDSNYGYVDIHYAGTSANKIAVDFECYADIGLKQSCVAESLQAVADSPSGETVVTTYTFVANTNGDVTSSYSITKSTGRLLTLDSAYRYGKVVHMQITAASSSTASEGSNIATGTLNGAKPSVRVSNAAYYDNRIAIITINTDGAITVRLSKGNMESSYTVTFGFTFICS